MPTIFANGDTSSVIRLGSAASNFTLVPGARLRENKFGLDEITRVYIGPTALALAFAQSAYTDPEFPNLYKVDHDCVVIEGGMSSVTIDYKGRVSTPVTQPFNVYTDGPSLASQSTQFLLYLTGGQILTVGVQYLAPSTTYRWATGSKPGDNPLYSTVQSSINPWDKVESWRLSIPSGTHITSSTVAAIQDWLRKHYEPMDMIVQYDPMEVVRGKFWECTCKVSRILNQILQVQ